MRSKLHTSKKTLHLNLKGKWFEMINQGVKKEEYRDLSDYWNNRFKKLFPMESMGETYYPIVETIMFSNGYSKDRKQMEVELKGIRIGTGKDEWGAKKGTQYYVIRLGKVIQRNFKQ